VVNGRGEFDVSIREQDMGGNDIQIGDFCRMDLQVFALEDGSVLRWRMVAWMV